MWSNSYKMPPWDLENCENHLLQHRMSANAQQRGLEQDERGSSYTGTFLITAEHERWNTDKLEVNLTWGSNAGQSVFWPFPNLGGVACHRVWLVLLLHLLLEWRGSWQEGKQGRNGRGRDEEPGSRTHLHLNWPDEKQAGLTTLSRNHKRQSQT